MLEELAERIEAQSVPREQWYWCGYAGHLIVADRCRFHLHTRVGNVIVSTIGDYRPAHKKGERDRIGCDRYFETFVFRAKDTERPEGEPASFSEIDSEGSDDSEESERQHYAMCEKWATAEMQAEARDSDRRETLEDMKGCQDWPWKPIR